MTRHIILAAGHDSAARTTVAQVIARENRWPLLSSDTLSEQLTDHVLSAVPAELTEVYRGAIVAPAQLDALIATMWAQVDADVDAVILNAPFVEQVADADWLNDLNYDLALRGYEATVVYLLEAGERDYLAPEHFVIDAQQSVDELFAAAASIAKELR